MVLCKIYGGIITKTHKFQLSAGKAGVGGLYFIALETTPILLAGSVSYTHNAKDSKGN